MYDSLRPLDADLSWDPPSGTAVGSVGWLTPWSDRFSCFVRVLHPVTDYPRNGLRWRDVARANVAKLSGDVQLRDIATGNPDAWAPFGDMGKVMLDRVLDVLSVSTTGEFVLGLWDGDRWVSNGAADELECGSRVTASDWNSAGVLHAPNHRTYRLFASSLLSPVIVGSTASPTVRQPTVMWSRDNSFCVATDPDHDSTIVAASAGTCRLLLATEEIEAISVDRSTSLLAVPPSARG